MRTSISFIAAVSFLGAGCASKPNQVEFIVPDGFRGAFAIRPDDPDGVLLKPGEKLYQFRIPKSGVLGMRGYDPFRSYLCTARFENGDPIWVSKRFNDKPQASEVGLFGGHTHITFDGNDTPQATYWEFVGTEAEWKASSDEARNTPGTVVPQDQPAQQ
jgi:hypothetical protein